MVTNFVSPVDKDKWIDEGDYYLNSSNIKQSINKNKRDDFYMSIENDEKAKLKVLRYTREGDPVIETIKYKKGKVIRITDYRRDKHAPGLVQRGRLSFLGLFHYTRTIEFVDFETKNDK
jgi:uncharacterized membrane protein